MRLIFGGDYDPGWSYTPEQQRVILAALDMRDPNEASKAMEEIEEAARTFQGLLEKERATPGDVKKQARQQLRELGKVTERLRSLLVALHEPAEGELRLAGVDPILVNQGLRRLWLVASRAGEAYEARGRLGSFACRYFAGRLVSLWVRYGKPGPGHTLDPLTEEHGGRFLVFGRACASPIRRAGNIDNYLLAAFRARDDFPEE